MCTLGGGGQACCLSGLVSGESAMSRLETCYVTSDLGFKIWDSLSVPDYTLLCSFSTVN
jgi:hypothetical protein